MDVLFKFENESERELTRYYIDTCLFNKIKWLYFWYKTAKMPSSMLVLNANTSCQCSASARLFHCWRLAKEKSRVDKWWFGFVGNCDCINCSRSKLHYQNSNFKVGVVAVCLFCMCGDLNPNFAEGELSQKFIEIKCISSSSSSNDLQLP